MISTEQITFHTCSLTCFLLKTEKSAISKYKCTIKVAQLHNRGSAISKHYAG